MRAGYFPWPRAPTTPRSTGSNRKRGVLPLDAIHVPRRLARTIRSARFEIRIDSDFDGVLTGCAASRPGRRSTWINARIRKLYRSLFDLGHCHTVEVLLDGKLVGGLYGVALGSAFFGESMFSTERDASKVALVYLAARLIRGGYTLLDTQFVTDHLRQFGTVELDKEAFHGALDRAINETADFLALPEATAGEDILKIVDDVSRLPPRSAEGA